jgi:speckle-type POZ protein
MFQTDFVESKTRIVDIADIDMDVFKEMLTYIYTGKAPNMEKKNFARSVYEVADKYDIESLKDVCEDLLVTQLSNSNAMELIVWAQFHSLPNLIENTVQFIARNSQELCSQPAWLDFVKDHPQLCVKIMQRTANIVQDYYSDKK